MELNLQPLAYACYVTGEPFAEGQRVASYLVRDPKNPEVLRFDVLETAVPDFVPLGFVACSWTQAFKPRRAGENPDRAMKLTAENLFITLADPLTDPTEENSRLLQFLALMLERKRILRPKGKNPEGTKKPLRARQIQAAFRGPGRRAHAPVFYPGAGTAQRAGGDPQSEDSTGSRGCPDRYGHTGVLTRL